MSRFYLSADSDSGKKSTTRRGHKHLTTHTRGWSSGVRVECVANGEQDEFRIYLTGGSEGSRVEKHLLTVDKEFIDDHAQSY